MVRFQFLFHTGKNDIYPVTGFMNGKLVNFYQPNQPTMYKFICLCSLVLSSFYSLSQTSVSEGARLLFKDAKTKLTNADKNQIYKLMNFDLSKDKKLFVLKDADAADFPFNAIVFPTDLNKDGTEEVFIVFGNSYTSGNTGSSVVLFIKKSPGIFNANLGFPGVTPDVMPTVSKGYPDLLIGGPGFEYPVWRWNGKEYAYYRNIKEQDMIRIKPSSVMDVSNAYQNRLQ